MSLLRIVQRASDSIGLGQYDFVIGNTERDVRQLSEKIQTGGEDIATMSNSNNGSWSMLERINEFETVDNQAEYDLPDDFSKLITRTAWAKNKYWLLRGSMSPQKWQQIRNRKSTTAYNVYRILRTASSTIGAVNGKPVANMLRKFTLEPPPGGGETLLYEYVSTAWWVSADGQTFKSSPTDDTDESVFGDTLHVLDAVWRFKAANGFSYESDLGTFEAYRDKLMMQDENQEFISVGYDRRLYGNYTESDVEWVNSI